MSDYEHDEEEDRLFDEDRHCGDDRDDSEGSCSECAVYGDYQCSRHGEAILAQQRYEHEQWLRESGQGRRGPYWRPAEQRVGLRIEPARGANKTAYRQPRGEKTYAYRAIMFASDPLEQRGLHQTLFRGVDHDKVLRHLRGEPEETASDLPVQDEQPAEPDSPTEPDDSIPF